MNNKYWYLFCFLFSLTLNNLAFSQPSFSANTGYLDPAINHNRLVREQSGDGVYKLISVYKVIGTSYLFGEKAKGDLFSAEAMAYNIYLSYNTFNQEVEFYSASNPEKPLIKEPGTVDSFMINADEKLGITHPFKFIYGSHLGSTEKAYFKEIYAGTKFSIYKRYKSELGYVSSNYVQSELRQFDLTYDYFYLDLRERELKKIKPNVSTIIKTFKEVKDISPVLTAEKFSINQEDALKTAFEYLNK